MKNNLTTREILEAKFKEYGLDEDSDSSLNTPSTAGEESASVSKLSERTLPEVKISVTEKKEPVSEQASLKRVPKSFKAEFAETFSSLDPKWQQYLLEHEEEIEKHITKLMQEINQSKWADALYEAQKDALKLKGIDSSKEWVTRLIRLEKMMDMNPVETLRHVARAYGVPLNILSEGYSALPMDYMAHSSLNSLAIPEALFSFNTDTVQNTVDPEAQLAQQFLREQMHRMAHQELDRQLQEKDSAGQFKYPYQGTVREQVVALLKSGQAQDVTSAYEKAIWMNQEIRDRLIQERVEQELAKKSREAVRAKTAAFSPKGKGSTSEKNSTKSKTTRQILEEAMRNMDFD